MGGFEATRLVSDRRRYVNLDVAVVVTHIHGGEWGEGAGELVEENVTVE